MEEEPDIKKILSEIKTIKERLLAIEREQRMIRQDILSGEPAERMKKRMLKKPDENTQDKKKKIDKDIKIEI